MKKYPFAITFGILCAPWAILAGCMSNGTAPAPVAGLQDSSGNAVPVTVPLVGYTPEFSAKVAAELKAAPPEIKQTVTDYEKLRCAINPALPICPDLLK